MQYKINEYVGVNITLEEAGFDKACSLAMRQALVKFGADDDGHLNNVEGHQRSTDSLKVDFRGYDASTGMGGPSHYYKFAAWVERVKDE